MISIVYFMLISVAYVECFIIFKCCPEGKALNNKHICENSDESWDPIFYLSSETIPNPSFTIPTNVTYRENTLPLCNSSNYLYVSNQRHVVFINGTGSLLINYGNVDIYVNPGNYCISPKSTTVCLDKDFLAKQRKKRIPKCCPVYMIYSRKERSCVPLDDDSNKSSFSEDTFIYSGLPQCNDAERLYVAGKLDDGYSLNMNGTLQINGTSRPKTMDNYCMDYVLEEPDEKANIISCIFDDRIFGKQFIENGCIFWIILIVSMMNATKLYGNFITECITYSVICSINSNVIPSLIVELRLDDRSDIYMDFRQIYYQWTGFAWLLVGCYNSLLLFGKMKTNDHEVKAWEGFQCIRFVTWLQPVSCVLIGMAIGHDIPSSSILKRLFSWINSNHTLFFNALLPIALISIFNVIFFRATIKELAANPSKKGKVDCLKYIMTGKCIVWRSYAKFVIFVGVGLAFHQLIEPSIISNYPNVHLKALFLLLSLSWNVLQSCFAIGLVVSQLKKWIDCKKKILLAIEPPEEDFLNGTPSPSAITEQTSVLIQQESGDKNSIPTLYPNISEILVEVPPINISRNSE